tara:strand:- start:61827 stop:62162 length:336 start_codon:yes stop_codon:yes gene_type:complete
MITLYHNPRCSKSRQTFNLLEEQGMQVDVKLYLERPMEKEILAKALQTLGDSIIRKNESDYKEFILGKNLEGDALVEAMIAHPKTIERPLVINGEKMALGRPIENVIKIIK